MHSILEDIKSGTPLILPTDIGFELVCDATNEKAVATTLSLLPNRSDFAIIVPNLDHLAKYITELPEVAADLIELSTSPLTVVLPTTSSLFPSAIISNQKGPFRVVSNGLIHNVAFKSNRPLLAIPAENTAGSIPTSINNIPDSLKRFIKEQTKEEQEHPYSGKLPSIIELKINGEIKILKP